MTKPLEIEKVENGFILKEKFYGGQTYVFPSFSDLIEWIKSVYEWK